ncbi:MAG: rhomboid family intramembrane serine protease [Bryobacterales bacterium]|nr:rhomboid family intramembrane serine protease [Bryobacterales bacterium]
MRAVKNSRMCPNCRAFTAVADKVCPYCETPLGAPAAVARTSGEVLGGLIPHARFTTMMLLLVNSALFAATWLFDMRQGADGGGLLDISGRTLVLFGGKWNQGIAAGQWWRLVTAGFLHGGLLHIGMNSWALMDLGAQVEELYGSARLLIFYFIATVFGFYLSAVWSPVLSIGASAGIFGLIGAMIALGVRHNTAMGSAIRGMYIRWAIYGLLFGLLPGLHIDNAAHIGGLIAGFAVAFLAREPHAPGSTSERAWQAIAGLCLLVTGFSFVRMFLWMTTQI